MVLNMGSHRPAVSLSDGEQRLGIAYVALGFFGAVLALAVQSRLGDSVGGPPVLDLRTVWMCFAGALGTGYGFHICRTRIGVPGLTGGLYALAQGIWVTMVSAVIAGTITLPVFGTMFAPWLLFTTFLEVPILLAMWACVFTAAHLLAARWQAERNSIFVPIQSAR